ncbi:MarR family transcriptional regulator [Virgibacillus phasianinus]|uniref:MarR family transcriptional regulator n=1 Tax=Virgibacillus phasianinus TaxID=2017483 RepID=A0A220TZ00_9BACI|nr:MarR family winged helix-turn-helix transcriptional regulator [Virgibacillus phasianinus]ASK60921.1 MarR family transcriptional regulator [Virgibacillus phasianinus]
MDIYTLISRYQTAMNTIYRGVNSILKEKIHSDITTDQFSTLQYIRNHETCTSTEIAHAFGVGKSAVTAQINRLFDKDLIERNRDQADRRNVYLYVTPKGLKLVDFTEKEVYAVIGDQLSHFDKEEITMFIQSIEKLANVMDNKEGDRS